MDLVMENVRDALAAAAKGPAEEVKAGKVPLPQSIGIQPYSEDEAKQSYAYLEDASSIAALQTTIFNEDFRAKRGQPEHYNINIAAEASMAFADIASAGYRAMEGPLSLFYSFTSSEQHIFNQSMSRSEVHLKLLNELFKDYSLPKPALLQLDDILTNFVSSLKAITFDSQHGSTVDLTFRINQIVRIESTAHGEDSTCVYQPRTRIVCLKIDPNTYRWATDKAGDDSATFEMRYATYDFVLDVNKFLASRERFDIVFQGLGLESITSYARKINKLLVSE